MEEEGATPDHLRCNRTDGRQWRCKRRVMEGKKLCELHYVQGSIRQKKQKVPESMKMQRKKRIKNAFEKNKLEIRAKLLKLARPMKRKRVIGGEPEALDEAVRKMKLKRGNLPLELIRMVLKREAEKNKKKREESDCSDFDEDDDEEEEEIANLMRELPNGLMAISSSSPHFDNAGSCSGSVPCINVKVGETETNTVAMTGRRFRSKNVQRLPVGTLQFLPCKKNGTNLRRGRRIRCHWCRKGGASNLIKCSSCKEQLFCLDCIKEQYFSKQDEVHIACPVCCGTCGCKICSVNQCRVTECKEILRDKNIVDKVLDFHYLICMLLPVFKRINQDQSAEIDVEAKIQGKKLCDIQVQQAEFCGYKEYAAVTASLSYWISIEAAQSVHIACLSCCRDIFQGNLVGSIKELNCKCPKRRKTCFPGVCLSDRKSVRITRQTSDGRHIDSSVSFPSRKAPDGSVPISCPPREFGGCGDGLLGLKCILPLCWFKELEVSAEEIVGSCELPEAVDTFSCCSQCPATDYEAKGVTQLQEASRRENSNDNFLFYPTNLNIHGDNLEHFQKHWGKGHPVIVRNVLRTTALSWDPLFLFCSYLKNSLAKAENEELHKDTAHLDWFEVEIGIVQSFLGSLRKLPQSSMCDEKLKLKGHLSSQTFHEQFPDHYIELVRSLPLPDYMDPGSGVLNIAARLPQEFTKPDLGPSVSISYCSGEELVQANSVTKLCYSLCDIVNVLAHATDAPVSMKQLNKIRKLMKKKQFEDQKELAKTNLDQNMATEAKEKGPSHDENMEEVGLNGTVGKEMYSHHTAPKVSRSPSAVHEAHVKEDSSDSESDSDCNSNSEAALLPSNTIHSSEALEDHEILRTRTDLAKSCGAEWDVFRRQDVPKLMEYLKKYSNEFDHTFDFQKHVVHPILDQNFFLDACHKRRLKEEYEIEPWTFEQHVGEAIIIPAGCPYQIRNVKSCVNVVLEFISPENMTKCIQLIDELRLLPDNHRAKAKKFEVEKMALYRISAAIKEIRKLMNIMSRSRGLSSVSS
ncbi:Lysine-specific demethylase 3B, putative isoform 3 [Hibiscus syriacus]|uniref:Lysine-specific demethylase 3B, putative isoform 3 n=1 Tax=Hibiscus syriacus TaxID=106335 RepID=A0A6A2XZS9_HIBSY|nr:Lysine-specific demethylase 3B, putative isoform 3 [Hibiscus syriacus]